MKIIVNKSDLASTLAKAATVINEKVTKPILKGILVEIKDGYIVITATDLEQTIIDEITATVEISVADSNELQSFVIQEFKMFCEIVKKSDCIDIELEIVPGTKDIKIKSGKAKFKASIHESNEYPKQEDLKSTNTISISEKELKKIFISTMYAVSDIDSKPALSGLRIIAENQIFICTGCDGHRIANKTASIGKCEKVDVIVIKKAVQNLIKILHDTDECVSISVGDKQILFETSYIKYTARLISDSYPNTSIMITNDWTTRIGVDRKGLINVISRSTIFTNDNNKKPVILEIKDGRMTVSLKGMYGGFIETIDEVTIEGTDICIAFNPVLLINLLTYEESEKVVLNMTNSRSPLIIKNDDNYGLLLPVNIAQVS